MSLLNHIYVVSTVSTGKCNRVLHVILDYLSNLGLLSRGTAEHHNGSAL
jgi:hypothetical protein